MNQFVETVFDLLFWLSEVFRETVTSGGENPGEY